MKKTMLDPAGINLLADALLEKVYLTDAAYVGGLAIGAVPLVVATVMRSHGQARPLKGFWVRKEQKDHGTRNSADGYIVDGTKVVMLEDVTTTGESVMKAINEARQRHCEVTAVITVVDRQEGARENLEKQGITLLPVFDRSDFGL
jgi:orotate phosphoribosyltransferase